MGFVKAMRILNDVIGSLAELLGSNGREFGVSGLATSGWVGN